MKRREFIKDDKWAGKKRGGWKLQQNRNLMNELSGGKAVLVEEMRKDKKTNNNNIKNKKKKQTKTRVGK